VSLLQEHCIREVGKQPTYSVTVEKPPRRPRHVRQAAGPGVPRLPLYHTTVSLSTGEWASATSEHKKRAKQKCALAMLRQVRTRPPTAAHSLQPPTARTRHPGGTRHPPPDTQLSLCLVDAAWMHFASWMRPQRYSLPLYLHP